MRCFWLRRAHSTGFLACVSLVEQLQDAGINHSNVCHKSYFIDHPVPVALDNPASRRFLRRAAPELRFAARAREPCVPAPRPWPWPVPCPPAPPLPPAWPAPPPPP